MNTPEKVIYTLLEADSAFGALVGDRLYHGMRPKGDSAVPAAVHELVSDNELGARRLAHSTTAAPWIARVQVSCIGATAEAAAALAEAVVAACRRQSGVIGGITVEDLVVQRGPGNYDPTVEHYVQPVDCIVTYQR